jgi:hypothetical protein
VLSDCAVFGDGEEDGGVVLGGWEAQWRGAEGYRGARCGKDVHDKVIVTMLTAAQDGRSGRPSNDKRTNVGVGVGVGRRSSSVVRPSVHRAVEWKELTNDGDPRGREARCSAKTIDGVSLLSFRGSEHGQEHDEDTGAIARCKECKTLKRRIIIDYTAANTAWKRRKGCRMETRRPLHEVRGGEDRR